MRQSLQIDRVVWEYACLRVSCESLRADPTVCSGTVKYGSVEDIVMYFVALAQGDDHNVDESLTCVESR